MGGISVIENKKVTIIDIPTIVEKKNGKIRNKYDVNALADVFKGFTSGNTFAVLEAVTAMPHQGVVSMVSIGYGSGLYQGILAMQRISYEIVHPKRWQKEFHISGAAGDTKGQGFSIASRLFPDMVLKTPRGRLLDGRVDSLLICEYCRRKKCGELENKE
jgi:hypothetical protein